MLSTRLTPAEREHLMDLSAKLDGMPYTEKAAIMNASLESLRGGCREASAPASVIHLQPRQTPLRAA